MVAVVVGVVVGVDGGCLGPPLLVTPPEDVKSRLPAPPGLAENEEELGLLIVRAGVLGNL